MDTTQVLRAVPGITYRQLDYWVRKGYLGDECRGEGSGRPRVFDDGHVALLKVMTRLIRVGVPPANAAVLATPAILLGNAAEVHVRLSPDVIATVSLR